MATLQNIITREDCEKIIKRSLNQSLENLTYKLLTFHEDVAGFLGEHYKLVIKGTINNVQIQISYFLKNMPLNNQNQCDYVQNSGIFKKEVLLYQNLLTELLKIGNFGPRCFFIKESGSIVLEDMTQQGYRMLDKFNFLSEDRCFGLLKNLARFHASTLIYESKRGVKLNEKFPEEIKETCFSFIEGQPRHKWCVSVTKCVNDLLKFIVRPEKYPKICDSFQYFVFNEIPSLIQPSKKYINVLIHDDLWCNNILFNEKSDCVFVDFQLVRYAPPAFDFLTSLLLNLEYNYFKANFNNFVHFYYTCVGEELKTHGLDISFIFSKDEFEESLEFYKLVALTETAMYATHIYISEELSNNIISDFNNFNEFSFVNRSKFVVKEYQENSNYRKRMNMILKPLAEMLETKYSHTI